MVLLEVCNLDVLTLVALTLVVTTGLCGLAEIKTPNIFDIEIKSKMFTQMLSNI